MCARAVGMSNTQEIADVYAAFEVLVLKESAPDDCKTTKKDLEKAFKTLLSSRVDSSALQLCAQFIPRFMHFFPKLHKKAVDRQLDLVECSEQSVRILAIKGLPVIAQNNPDAVGRMADVLGQLLLLEDYKELTAAKNGFDTLTRIDLSGTLSAYFSQLSEETALSEKVFAFLDGKLTELLNESSSPTNQNIVIGAIIGACQSGVADKYIVCLLSTLNNPGIVLDQDLKDIYSSIVLELSQAPSANFSAFLTALKVGGTVISSGPSVLKFIDYFYSDIAAVIGSIPYQDQIPLLKQLDYLVSRLLKLDGVDISNTSFLQSHVSLLKLIATYTWGSSKSDKLFRCTIWQSVLNTLHNLLSKDTKHGLEVCGLTVSIGETKGTSEVDVATRDSFLSIFENELKVSIDLAEKCKSFITRLKSQPKSDANVRIFFTFCITNFI